MNSKVMPYNYRIKLIISNIIFTIFYLIIYSQSLKFLEYILIIIYILFNLIISEKDVLYNQIILSVLLTSIYDMIWRRTNIEVPLHLKYLVDFLSIIILLKITVKYKEYLKGIKDSITISVIAFILISFVISLMKDIPFNNFINSIRIYFRFIPMYVLIASKVFNFTKKEIKYFIIINIILFLVQIRFLFLDDRSGVFGVSNVQVLFLFLLIILGFSIVNYINKKISVFTFLIINFLIYSVVIINESKIALIIFPFITIISIFLDRGLRSLVFILIISIFVLTGVKLIPIINPQFNNFFNKNIVITNIERYLFKPQSDMYVLGRLENIQYTNRYVLDNWYDKLLGNGVGSSMPSENWYYNLSTSNNGRKVIEPSVSKYYYENGPYLGYHTSGFNVLYLESGILGVGIYIFITLIFFLRSIKIYIDSKDIYVKCWAYSGVIFIISWVPLLFYYNYLIDRNAEIMYMFILGIVSYHKKN